MSHGSALKQRLRQSALFRTLFALPLAWRARLINQSAGERSRRYTSVVRGGRLILTPANLRGEFELDARSDLARRIVTGGQYEPEVTEILAAFANLDGFVVNIGANVGLMAIHMASTFKRLEGVLAVEPNPEAFTLLEANIARNDLAGRVQSARCCIGASEGTVDFAMVAGKPEYSSIGGIAHGSVKGLETTVVKVPIHPLAAVLGDRKASLIVIDTEGAEAQVIRGAMDVLRRDRPTLLFECLDPLLKKFGDSSAICESLLTEAGYVVRDACAPSVRLKHPFEGEVLAWPSEKNSPTVY